MTSDLRFLKAIDSTRPFKSHRYDVFGPKVQRMVTLFGRTALNTWLQLESDPGVLGYCERPIVLEGVKPRRVVDFWVGRRECEELWLVLRHSETAIMPTEGGPTPAFKAWAASQGMDVRLLDPNDWAERDVYFENWGAIVRYLSANRRLHNPKLVDEVYRLLDNDLFLAEIEAHLTEHDPTLIRTAVFSLLHTGRIQCPGLASERIGPRTRLERV